MFSITNMIITPTTTERTTLLIILLIMQWVTMPELNNISHHSA